MRRSHAERRKGVRMSDSMDAADFVALGRKKRSKYGNVKTEVDGITFDSAAEARRYGQLRMLEQAGVVANLELQPRFPLIVNGVTIAEYRADFRYRDPETGLVVIEDVKGGNATRTPQYRIKRKLMRALYGVSVVEIEA